jgi:hypothetical protein
LKYVLVPQAPATGAPPANYYDGSIPELLEAPLANSPMDYTSGADLVVPAAKLSSHPYPSLNDLLPNVDIPQINIPQLSDGIGNDLDTVLQQVSQAKLVVSTEKIDAMERNVNAVLQAAKTVLTSSFDLAANSPLVEAAAIANTKLKDVAIVANKNIVDPVVDRTMSQLKYAVTHPPDFSGYSFAGAPPDQGLATPLLDYVTRSLKAAQEQPPLFFADPLPNSYETVQYGFQVKNTAIETAQQIKSAIIASAQEIAANNEIAREEVRKVMLREMEQMQARNALIAENVAAQSQNNLEFLHDSQVAISNRILDNADTIENQLHLSEWSKSAEQQIALLQQNFIGALRNNDLSQSDQVNKVLASLKVEELSGWYTGAFFGLILLFLVQKDKQAAIDAATTKLTLVTQKQIEQANIEKERLEDMVVELTQAVAILTEELRTLKSQRVQTDSALASVQNDVNFVFNQKLAESIQQNDSLRNQLEFANLEVQSLKEANVRKVIVVNAMLFSICYAVASSLTLFYDNTVNSKSCLEVHRFLWHLIHPQVRRRLLKRSDHQHHWTMHFLRLQQQIVYQRLRRLLIQ